MLTSHRSRKGSAFLSLGSPKRRWAPLPGSRLVKGRSPETDYSVKFLVKGTNPTSSAFRSVCRWEVVDYRDYRIYHSGRIPGPKPRCQLLLQADGSGHAGEGFRLSLEGDRLEADLWTSDVFAETEFGGFRLRYDIRVSVIELRPNTFSSRWEDIITLVGKGQLVASLPDAAEDCSAEFRQAYAETQEENPHLGAVIRWTVQAKDSSTLKLVLQCLPTSAEKLRADPRLSADDGPGIHLETIDLEVEMLSGEPGPGPVPILFARDPSETRDSLGSNPGNVITGRNSLTQ